MKRWLRYALFLCMTVLTVACDNQGRPVEEAGLDKLAKGISSEADVRLAMGQPDAVWEEPDGSRALQYPKGPAGARTWTFLIDRSGKLKDFKQVLNEETFSRIAPGMTKEEISKMLGRPKSVMQFKQKKEEVWDWRYMSSTDATGTRLFNVHFDMDTEKVTRTSTSNDGNY